jgi:hypothetical protein
VNDEPEPDVADDPFDVASGDMDAVARRVEKLFDAAEISRGSSGRARTSRQAGRSRSTSSLAGRTPTSAAA